MLAHRIQLAAAAGHPAILCIHTAVTGKGMWQEAFFFVFLRSGPFVITQEPGWLPDRPGWDF